MLAETFGNEKKSKELEAKKVLAKLKLFENTKGGLRWQDLVIILLMGVLLFYGASWQIWHTNTDAAKYECYAVAFWQGADGLKNLPQDQCEFVLHTSGAFASNAPTTAEIAQWIRQQGWPASLSDFVASQGGTQPFHILPHEYPFSNVLVFSLGLIAPAFLPQIAIAIWMILFASSIYLALLHFRSRGAAVACALYFVAGGWGTLAGRYDIVPAALTLFAVLCAVRQRWNWSFALLALATLSKLYPVLLLPYFLLVQQRSTQAAWYSLRRWQPLATYVVLCLVVIGASLLFSVEGTLAPFTYFSGRPIQAESFSASLLWLADLLTGQPEHYVHTFGSLNVLSANADWVALIAPVLEAVGLLALFGLLWWRKVDLPGVTLLVLLLILLTGKVFSPQYLIWLIPLLAYVGQAERRWLMAASLLCLLTTAIYPFLYTQTNLLKVPLLPLFFPAVTVRNFLLFGMTIALFVYYGKQRAEWWQKDEQAAQPVPASDGGEIVGKEVIGQS
jgi:hypothetical protein